MLLFLLLAEAYYGNAYPLRGKRYEYNSDECTPWSFASTQRVQRSTTMQTVPWQQEPSTHGTFRLFISCVITLSLCVWTAIHLNIVRQTVEIRHGGTDFKCIAGRAYLNFQALYEEVTMGIDGIICS